MSISPNSHPYSGASKCPDAQGQRSALARHVRQVPAPQYQHADSGGDAVCDALRIRVTHLSRPRTPLKPKLKRPFGLSLRQNVCVTIHCVNLN